MAHETGIVAPLGCGVADRGYVPVMHSTYLMLECTDPDAWDSGSGGMHLTILYYIRPYAQYLRHLVYWRYHLQPRYRLGLTPTCGSKGRAPPT